MFLIDDFPNNAVCAAADFLYDFVVLEDVRFDFVVGLAHYEGG